MTTQILGAADAKEVGWGTPLKKRTTTRTRGQATLAVSAVNTAKRVPTEACSIHQQYLGR